MHFFSGGHFAPAFMAFRVGAGIMKCHFYASFSAIGATSATHQGGYETAFDLSGQADADYAG
ncbi:hypothetical protein EGN69_01470 [Pseudomonas monteilii]|nr:hypothetical protein EGN69_01470 [Pseudomonas monteilii]